MLEAYTRRFQPRQWSNDVLRSLVPYLRESTRVVNVSGWEDRDKEGGHYRDYFRVRAAIT